MLPEKLERKLTYFANAMQQQLDEKKHQATLAANSENQKSTAATLESTTRRNKIMLTAKRGELQRDANRKIAHAKVKAMAEYVASRKNLIDRLFVEIAAGLASFTQEDGYKSYLIERIEKAKTAYTFSIVKLSPHDMRLEDAIKTATGLTPETGKDDYIGGFVLLNESRSVMVDHTFKTRLQAAKKEFVYDQNG